MTKKQAVRGRRPRAVGDAAANSVGRYTRSCDGRGLSRGTFEPPFGLVGRGISSVGNSIGTWRAHRARMAHASFEQFRAQWIPVAHSAASVQALTVLASKEPTVAALGKDDLGQLVDALCGDARSVDPVSADRAIGAMVASQVLDPLIALAVVMALTPGLKVVARRLEWGAGGPWGHPEVFSGDLITTAWEVVAAWEGRRRLGGPEHRSSHPVPGQGGHRASQSLRSARSASLSVGCQTPAGGDDMGLDQEWSP